MTNPVAEIDVKRFEDWVTRNAKHLASRIYSIDIDWHDLAQAAWIRMMDAHAKFNGHNGDAGYSMWMRRAGRWGMVDFIDTQMVVSRRQLLSRFDNRDTYANQILEDVEPDFAGEATDRLTTVMASAEIAEAIINVLTPKQRDYVIRRFFKGEKHSEIEAAYGYNCGSIWADKRNGAKMRLQKALAHLA